MCHHPSAGKGAAAWTSLPGGIRDRSPEDWLSLPARRCSSPPALHTVPPAINATHQYQRASTTSSAISAVPSATGLLIHRKILQRGPPPLPPLNPQLSRASAVSISAPSSVPRYQCHQLHATGTSVHHCQKRMNRLCLRRLGPWRRRGCGAPGRELQTSPSHSGDLEDWSEKSRLFTAAIGCSLLTKAVWSGSESQSYGHECHLADLAGAFMTRSLTKSFGRSASHAHHWSEEHGGDGRTAWLVGVVFVVLMRGSGV
ncbi:uncharacterized protein LOC122251465 [Penaeus japonicus]|uniref:uncharacterized protein LOC122251465 n=1 Tax=Penaeus japonicus TaxID=27405 RepID=UPI001C717A3E|nr:uncharacterized protein LOC122251465 [Penaeus japonicus]